MQTRPLIAVCEQTDSSFLSPADLARQVGLPLASAGAAWDFLLFWQQGRLSLRATRENPAAVVCVDFENEGLRYRQQRQTQPEALLKAAGLKQGQGLHVIDATAGLGLDAFLLAAAGCQVEMFERSPILHALLSDGLRRAALSEDARIVESVARMRLHLGNSVSAMHTMQPQADVVYLDPMFPERKKSARVKKNMFLLQQLLHAEEEPEGLLEAALQCAAKRVVVKRPRLAGFLGAAKPSFQLEGKSSRFDVYLTPKPAAT